eukprot:6352212-Pyramimonas_sp.AAC.1
MIARYATDARARLDDSSMREKQATVISSSRGPSSSLRVPVVTNVLYCRRKPILRTTACTYPPPLQ